MGLISWYRHSYRTWKAFQRFPEAARKTGRHPSETYFKYGPDHQFDGRIVLNFGCGKTVYRSHNVVNLDVVEGNGINVVCTTNKLPFHNEAFDFILANHVLEHVPNWFETFKEFARVLKPGGTIEVWIPPVSSDSAFTYRDHINRIGLLSFAGCASFPAAGQNILAEHDFKLVGDVDKLHIIRLSRRPIIKWWTMLAWPSLLDWMMTHLRNTVSEEQYVFKKQA